MSRMPPLPRLPFALLGLLTVACFGGPFALLIVRGGDRSGWPPDRAIEWIVIALVFAATAALFVACVTVGMWYRPPRLAGRPGEGEAPSEPVEAAARREARPPETAVVVIASEGNPIAEAHVPDPSSAILNPES
jgi:hypothetical protein